MENQARRLPQRWFTWHRYGLLDFAAIGAQLPVVENSVTQVAPGPAIGGVTIVSNGEVTAGRALIKPPSIGVMVLKRESIGFYIPLHWAGDLKFNGVKATHSAINAPVDDVYFHIRGREREVLGCILPRRRFVETVAALRGTDLDSLALHKRALMLPPEASQHLRTRLAAVIDESRRTDPESTSPSPPFDLSKHIFELMVDAYLHARAEPMRKSGRVGNPGRIVRAAEERFVQADGNPVSLADLCAAAGVGKTALYLAFQSWCGEPPIAYFHKRRLTQARSRLLHSEPQRGAVKRAALSAGITELGRFSQEYRYFFGESPSITLSHSLTAEAVSKTAGTDKAIGTEERW